MEVLMDEKTFLDFYKNTLSLCSNNLQRYICKKLEAEHRITFEEQIDINDNSDTVYIPDKKDFKEIITRTATDKKFIGFYEDLEFRKLYKYSVPFFYEIDEQKDIGSALKEKNISFFNKNTYSPEYIIDRTLKEATPIALEESLEKSNIYFLKFVLQKMYIEPDTFEQIDYRYPVIVYINPKKKFLEIRYDMMRYREQFSNETYNKIVNTCIAWLQEYLPISLYTCEHGNTIGTINDKQNLDVKMYKQMMEMSSGGSAELTASESTDYVLPFIGEIKELINENEDLFNESEEIKQLLLQYLTEKEATASYPYIYVKWVKPVESHSYIVKITFDYFNGKYTLLQHISGNCKDLEMGRMNDAIEYLCESGSFVKGEKI